MNNKWNANLAERHKGSSSMHGTDDVTNWHFAKVMHLADDTNQMLVQMTAY